MPKITVEVDPRELGFDEERLTRIDAHFARYVDERKLPGFQVAIARRGKLVHVTEHGQRDVDQALPVENDTIFRIYSMTKPITSVAAMMLYEEGAFELKDPVHRFIPSFEEARVFTGGSALKAMTEPLTEPMRMWHLLTHTSGLTYGFHYAHPTDDLYRRAGFEWGAPKGMDLAAACDAWAGLPLRFQPGSSWNYGVSTDVLGRVVEVISGQTLDVFLRERVFEPLGMVDTAFFVDEPDGDRLAAMYLPGPGGELVDSGPMGRLALKQPTMLSGGGGLVSTTHDYLRFAELLRRRGELDGVRLLGTRTVDFMARNHLPGGADLEQFGQSTFAETTYDGVGFGLGFAVTLDAAKNKVLMSEGEYMWGGAASTAFWVDPKEEITGVFMTQLLPSTTYNLRPQLKALTYQALVD